MPDTKYRSYDFAFGDEFYIDGYLRGYANCRYDEKVGGEVFGAIYDTLAEAEANGCPHYAIRVTDMSPAWVERNVSTVGKMVYPPVYSAFYGSRVAPLPAD